MLFVCSMWRCETAMDRACFLPRIQCRERMSLEVMISGGVRKRSYLPVFQVWFRSSSRYAAVEAVELQRARR